MANIDFFNQDLVRTKKKATDPFFTVHKKKDSEILQWLEDEVVNREEIYSDRFDQAKCNLKAYRGGYLPSERKQSESLESRTLHRRSSRYFVNYLYEMTENLVSRITRNKPAVEVIPSNDEYSDKNAAKAVKLLIKHLWYVNDIDFLLQKIHRHKYIFGEAFLKVDWDPEKGDFHPAYITLRDAGELKKVPKGSRIRVGDVCYKLPLPWNIMLEPKPEYAEVNDSIEKEILHVEEVKRRYPKFASEIENLATVQDFNLNSLRDETLEKHCTLYTYYHRSHPEILEGKKIVFIRGKILEKAPLGFSHGELPYVRITDIDIPGKLNGMSRYKQALPLQTAHNNLSHSIMKNEFLMAAPKWVMPRGACKVEQLGNGRTIIQYQGATPPQLVQMNPTSQTTFGYRDMTKMELGDMMGVGEISRGEPPKGVTAAVALQFLNEQEVQRSISDISKHNSLIVEIAKKTISVAGDYYEPDDGRMLRILGNENQYMLKFFDAANLHKDYDVRIQNSSALPQSQAARIERVLQTMQYAPQLFTPERWADLLEFGSTEKMQTLATEAIRAAESENEDILEGNPVEEPKEWEDHIIHLRVHYKKMQARSFKEDVPLERQRALMTHVKVTEMLAAEKAAINPLFGAKLAQLEQYPMFWKHEAVPASREQRQAEVNGANNRGEPTGQQMAAEEPESIPGEGIPTGRIR
jgi:hypothetical protein